MAGEAIEDPVVTSYVNEVVRPACDMLAQALSLIDQIRTDRRPDALDLDARIPPDGGPIVGTGGAGRGDDLLAPHVAAFFRACDVVAEMVGDDRDPLTGEHTGMTTRGLIHRIRVNLRLR